MDTARGIDNRNGPGGGHDDDGAVNDVALDIGGDERRMHVRAYNYWVSLLRGRAYPSIEDLEPGSIADFGTHSVLLDFTQGIEDPRIKFLGRTLREECAIEQGIERIADVPSRSLLSRLTDHYLQIIANRAPIGFEAEFIGTRGHNTLYRGILMPFSSDEDTIDYIYGVINWKEMVDAATQAQLTAEVDAARRVSHPPATAPVWADGPGSSYSPDDNGPDDAEPDEDAPLADRLSLARDSAAALAAADGRSRAALYRTLARAYQFARAAAHDVEGYAELLEDAGVKAQARAPMTPVVKLVFGPAYDKTRLTEFAAVLSHAERAGVTGDRFPEFIDGFAGGIKGIVVAERALRRKPAKPDAFAAIAAEMRDRAPLARIEVAHGGAEFAVLLARTGADGALEVIACVEDDTALTERVIRKAA